jgi:catechol 2,3-dioxygenase-like lactoylglutathione lyase family enzyme
LANGGDMGKIRHIAISSDQPGKAADFFKAAFGLQELHRHGIDEVTGEARVGAAVGLTDGYFNLTLIKFATDQTGVGLDYNGLHHFGFQVDDMDQHTVLLEGMGSPCIADESMMPPGAHLEIKFRGPDNVVFDISDRPWPGTK